MTLPTEHEHLSVLLSDDELAVRMLPLRALVRLDIVARCNGRLYVAAKAQGISTAALSTQISRLEARLGADVIKPTAADRRRFELTDKGRSLVQALRVALPALAHLSESFRDVMGSTELETRRRVQRRCRNGARPTVSPN